MKRYLPLVLALCLLAGCGERAPGSDTPVTQIPTPTASVGADAPAEGYAPSVSGKAANGWAVPIGPTPAPPSPSATPTPELTEFSTPIPSPEPTLPENALALLELSDTDYVMDQAAGDLNGDGLTDWAVVIEHLGEAENPEGVYKDAPRIITILLGDKNDGYILGQSSGREFVGRGCDGGVFGDPYEGIAIKNGELLYTEYGGSSDRWNPTFQFIWQGEGLVLARVTEICYSTHTLNGVRKEYDFLTKGYETWTYNDFCAVMEEPFEARLLYAAKLDQGPWRLEELERWEWARVELPPLPSLGYYEYETAAQGLPLERSAEEMLDIVKEEYYPDMWKVDIPWTGETKANYSAAVGYEVPGYYYTDGTSTLSYFDVEYHGYYKRYEHTVMREGTDSNFFWYWDDTGAERDFSVE